MPAYVSTDCAPGFLLAQCPQVGEPVALGVIPSTDLVNVNLNWSRIFGGPVDVALFVTNATDETYTVNTGGGWTSAGIGDLMMGAPRMYGARVRFNFGD